MKSPQTKAKTKTAKTSAPLSYLDTSVLRQLRFGHPEQKKALIASIPAPHYVSTYVLMEFIRGVILYYIELYFESAETRHPSFADACTFSTETFSNRNLKTLLGLTISLMQEQDFDPANPANKETCRRKLQDHIFSVAEELFSLYRNVGIAEEACSKLRKHLARKELEERDDHMLEFSEAFKNDKTCRSLCSVDALLKANEYRNSYQCVIDKGLAAGSTPTTKKLAAALKERIDSPDDTTCTRCSKIGDVIIAVNCPHNFQIHTLDTSFSTVAPCFSREVQIHPSTKALLKM